MSPNCVALRSLRDGAFGGGSSTIEVSFPGAGGFSGSGVGFEKGQRSSQFASDSKRFVNVKPMHVDHTCMPPSYSAGY